jgi:hypothetical protein
MSFAPFRRSFGQILIALLLTGAPTSSAPGQTLSLPPFPANLDLTSVEGLAKPAAYRVEARHSGTTETFAPALVFKARNDWIYYDFFNANPGRRANVLRTATQYGSGKADLRTASFAQFSFADTAVEVRITLLQPGATADSVTIRPLRRAIATTISADKKSFTFTLSSPQKISIEINDRLNPLFLFTDAPDTPDPAATYYYGPGLHRIPGDGTLTVRSNERVYLAAGAIVEGRILLATNSANITIRGRGILSNGEWPHPADITYASLWPKATIRSAGTHHLTIEGLTIIQSTAWQLAIEDYSTGGNATHDNRYLNLKMVSFAGNTDGIWITGTGNRAADCFIFNNDDAFVCKGGGDTTVSDCVVWGGVWSHLALLYPNGSNLPPIHDLTFERIDLIGKEGQSEVIHAATSATRTITNITFRDIRFEERRRPGNTNNTSYNAVRFVDFNTTDCDASITNLLFENIALDQRLPDEGYLLGSAARPYTNITFKNVTMGGSLILSAADSHLTFNQYTTNVRFLPPGAPALLLQPAPKVIAPGAPFLLQAAATGTANTFQWLRNGVALVGETQSSLYRPAATAVHTGDYTVRVTNAFGSTLSSAASVILDPSASRLVNLSCRTALATGGLVIPGFTLAGTGRKTVLIRAVGPGLAPFGVTGTLANPQLRVFRDATQIAANDDWDAAQIGDAFGRVGAFPLPPNSRDSALLVTLDAPAGYTVQVDSTNAGTGTVLVEIYDADTSSTPASRFSNVAVRGAAGTGDTALILGLVLQGNGSRSLLARGGGPGLAAFSVPNPLADPQLTVFDDARRVLFTNDDWAATALTAPLETVRALVGAFSYAALSRDAALLGSFASGAYTFQVSAAPNTAPGGEALIEVYAAP